MSIALDAHDIPWLRLKKPLFLMFSRVLGSRIIYVASISVVGCEMWFSRRRKGWVNRSWDLGLFMGKDVEKERKKVGICAGEWMGNRG
jgi:hypothetical protein